MEEYISKSALVVEIEKRKAELQSRIVELGTFESNTLGLFQEVDLYDDIISFLDTLEVKEEPVSEDLEQAAVEAFKHIVDSDKNNFYEIFKAGAQWQKEHILGDDNKQYHRLRHETLKRLYENETKLELMLDKALEGYIEKYEQIGGHNYLSLKIPMLSKPDDCKDGDKIKLIILKEE